MRRRIVTVALVSAVVALSLFGIPLAIAIAVHFVNQEATELEHTADIAALDVAADMVGSRRPGAKLTQLPGADIALYGPEGRIVSGVGPTAADAPVLQALADNTIHHQTGVGTMVSAVPIPDQTEGRYAIRASSPTSEVIPRIALTSLGMVTLAGVIIALTWQLARWQARRLAGPVEGLASSASRLADGDFTARASASGIPEIDTAADALNHAAVRIGVLIDRERAVTSHVSHQLRTPLTGLRLSLEAALHTPGADMSAAVRQAVASADRLEQTIDDLLALARNRDRRQGPPPDLSALIDEVKSVWRDVLGANGRSLNTSIEPGVTLPSSSAAALRQILAVLVDNAARHGRGTVTIHARETVGTVAIDVMDEGDGLRHAEDVFGQIRPAGNGIGLGLASTLAEAEGGRLILASRAPTTFTFLLPEDTA